MIQNNPQVIYSDTYQFHDAQMLTVYSFCDYNLEWKSFNCLSLLLQLAKRIKENQVCLGNVDTFLLWKFTGQKVFATDYSNASSTGLYDTYQVRFFVFTAVKENSDAKNKDNSNIDSTLQETWKRNLIHIVCQELPFSTLDSHVGPEWTHLSEHTMCRCANHMIGHLEFNTCCLKLES